MTHSDVDIKHLPFTKLLIEYQIEQMTEKIRDN